MKHHYHDIVEKLGTPSWWDENGTPRYCPFGPEHNADIYARQVALLLIQCQSCGHEFTVCMSSGPLEVPLSKRIDDHSIHYGDPPNTSCCAGGATMNSDPRRVVELWHRPQMKWERAAEYEREIPDG